MSLEYKVHETDVLIIGGGAGARAAIAADDAKASVTLVDKGVFGKSGITQLSFGIVCAYIKPPDSADVLFTDMVRNGEFLNNQKLVEIFANEIAQGKILELEGRYGFVFDRTKDGKPVQKQMGGHSYARDLLVTWNDAPSIWRGVIADFFRRGINVFNEVMVIDLLTCNGRCVGATAIDMRTGDFLVFKAKSTVLATGGLGQIYKLNDNARGSTGDGYSMAYKAGAELGDMEFVQTMMGFAWPKALRGVGIGEPALVDGRLYNSKGARFMEKIDPVKKDNLPKDIVGRAVMREIKEGRGTAHGGVWMDMKRMDKTSTHYFYLTPLAANVGIDLSKDYVESVPTVHYFMGGVRVNENHESSIPGLFAVGEVASGLHGAERLAGCSVADITVFGYRAGKKAAESAAKTEVPEIDWDQVESSRKKVFDILERRAAKGKRPSEIKEKIRDIMWEHVHMLRNEEELNIALDAILKIREHDLPQMEVRSKGRTWNLEWIESLEVLNMLNVAEIITEAAIFRKETRGAHEREDYPEKDDKKWLKNIIVRQEDEEMKLMTRTPVITKLKPVG